MVLSLPATNIQLGLLLHAAVVMTALKLSALFGTCDRPMKAACSADRSAAKFPVCPRLGNASKSVSSASSHSKTAKSPASTCTGITPAC